MINNELKFAHSADFHLMLTMYGRRDRGLDFFKSVISMLETVKSRGCRFVIAAGDLLDKRQQGDGSILLQLVRIEQCYLRTTCACMRSQAITTFARQAGLKS
jgi:hypothetical protein